MSAGPESGPLHRPFGQSLNLGPVVFLGFSIKSWVWAHLGSTWRLLGSTCKLAGVTWARLGRFLGSLGLDLGASWDLLGPSWASYAPSDPSSHPFLRSFGLDLVPQ